MNFDFLKKRIVPAQTKIVMLILDGLGGLPLEPGGKTELETADTPNLDRLAGISALGLSQPAGAGITVGSGPGHLAIFGYDPIEYEIQRGALEALGVDFDLHPEDIAARGNFCTLDDNGLLLDRRAGRLPTLESARLLEKLSAIQVKGVAFFLRPIKEHRFAFVMRGVGLCDTLSDTDPLTIGVGDLPVRALSQAAEPAAAMVNQFVSQARQILKDQSPANMILLRGFARMPVLPTYGEIFGLRSAAIAVNGMYRGVSRLAGMTVLDVGGDTPADEFAALEKHWDAFNFFYIHIKKTDTCGEKGDFAGKVRAIEEVDALMPRLLALNPDVVIVTGDHSSPAVMKAHSWHPVPLLIYSRLVRADGIAAFGERACARGSLGVMPAKEVMPLALANAGRLSKYGA